MRLVKRVGAALGGLVLLAVLGVVVKFYLLSPRMRPAVAMTAPATPEAIERGRYLANHVAACVACHSPVQEALSGEPPVDGKLGGGRDFGAEPGSPVHIRARNLTPDKATGIGDWTDGEVVRAMREGVGKDGRTLFPMMPYQTYAKTLSDADALAVVAYLRTLKPVASDPGPTTVGFPISMFIRGLPQPVTSPTAGPPPVTDKLARGRWLLSTCSCNDCHDSVDSHHEKLPGKALAGGGAFPIPGKGTVYAANITSDKATGIGAYADEDVRRALVEGRGRSGKELLVMPWYYYKGLTDEDREALIFALRQAPAVANLVPAPTVK